MHKIWCLRLSATLVYDVYKGAIHVGVAAPLYIYTRTMVSATFWDATHVEIAAPLPFFDDRCMFRLGNWADPFAQS